MDHSRFAIYYCPPPGPLAAFGATWLGWDVARGAPVSQPDLAGLDTVTRAPRKYGFHATLKPPFALAPGRDLSALAADTAELAQRLAPAEAEGLRPGRLGRFLALLPRGDTAGIARVAASCVTTLDPHRAPPSEAELARRRRPGLSRRQEEHLRSWGYPYVMDAFRFHMTLTGPLPEEAIGGWQDAAARLLPVLPQPFRLDTICLVGERADGRFEILHRYALTG